MYSESLMAPIVLKIVIVKAGITRAVQCDPLMTVYDTCQHIRQKIPQASTDKPHTYGLFCTTEDPTQGYWLESVRTLKSYGLRSGSVVQYGSKYRVVRVLTLDHTLRSLLVDESLPLSHITRNVCAKIGLSNPQEFSFTVDDDTNQFTLRKREHSKHDHALATMKKQLHTDDTLMWVSPTQTLRQQALLDSSVVLTLRKKLFFTDENVNSNDPVQLHLLFVQCREAIVEGAHPVTKQEAIQLAALQLQVEFGNQKEGHVDKNFVKSMLKQVLPQEYFKEKAIDTLISTEHRKLYELSVLNAKFRYIQLCRSLRTYGVSFFAVKEKTPGRNKLRPVLLGVSRDGVHRLDKTSKTLLQRWPLSTVKSYASTPSSFCLNFGGYESAHSGGVYVVKTSEGEAIGQLLEGYILLIMEAKPVAPMALPESSVSPHTEDIPCGQSSAVPNRGVGMLATPALSSTNELSEAEQNLQLTITRALEVVARGTLTEHPSPTIKGRLCEEQLALHRHTLTSSISSLLTHTAAMVTLSNRHSEDIDYTQLQATITALGLSLVGVGESCQLLAAMATEEGGGERILKELRGLSSALSQLLRSAEPRDKVVGNMLEAATYVACHCDDLLVLLSVANSNHNTSPLSQVNEVMRGVGVLMESARKLGEKYHNDDNTLVDLHLSIEAVESSCLSFTTSAALLLPHVLPSSTSTHGNSLTSMCIVSPTLCESQMIETCRYLAHCVETLCVSAQSLALAEPSSLKDVGESSSSLTHSLYSLLEAVRRDKEVSELTSMQDAYEGLLSMENLLQSPSDDGQLVVHQARALAESSRCLMQTIKHSADTHPDRKAGRQGLIDTVKELASATTHMARAARRVASTSVSTDAKKADLVSSVRALSTLATEAVTPFLKDSAISRLRRDAREAAVATTILCSLVSSIGDSMLLIYCGDVEEYLAEVVLVLEDGRWLEGGGDEGVWEGKRGNVLMELINAASSFIPVSAKLLSYIRHQYVPTISDSSLETLLTNITKCTTTRLARLRSTIAKVSGFLGSDIADSEISMVSGLLQATHSLLEECRHTPLSLLPCSSSSSSSSSRSLTSAAKRLQSLLLPLTMAEEECSRLSSTASCRIREIVQCLQRLTRAGHSVASRSERREKQADILETLLAVLERGQKVLVAAKAMADNPDQPDLPSPILHSLTDLSSSLNLLLSTSGQSLAGHPHHLSLARCIERAKLREDRKLFGGDLEKQIKDSLSDLNAMTSLLEEAIQPLSDSCYYDTVYSIETSIQNISQLLSEVQAEGFGNRGQSAIHISQYMCEILEATAQAAYLVGASHPSSVPASSQLIDQSRVSVSSHVILLSHQQLESGSTSSMWTLAHTISRYSGMLSDASKRAALLSQSPVTKCDFLRAARSIADTTAALLRGIEVCSKSTSSAGGEASTENKQLVLIGEGEGKGDREREEEGEKEGEGERETEGKREGEDEAERVENRRVYLMSLSQPLIKAVHDLETLSSVVQFSASPAIISEAGIAMQQDLLKSAQGALSASLLLVTSLTEGKESEGQSLLLGHCQSLVEALQAVLSALRSASPGERECESAMCTLTSLRSQLQQTIHQATNHTLTPSVSDTLPALLRTTVDICSAFQKSAKSLKQSATSQAENLAREVVLFEAHCSKLVQATVGAASRTTTSDLQQKLLDHCVTVVECALQLVSGAKEIRGDPGNHEGGQRVSESAEWVVSGLRDLREIAEDAHSDIGLIAGLVSEVIDGMSVISEAVGDQIDGDISAAECLNQLIHCTDTITCAMQNIILKATSDVSSLSSLRHTITSVFSLLTSAAQGVAANITQEELSVSLTGAIWSVGESLVNLLHSSAVLQVYPEDGQGRDVVRRDVGSVGRKLSQLVLLARQCVEDAHSTLQSLAVVRQLVSEIDLTTALVTAYSDLEEEEEEGGMDFEKRREEILKAAEAVAMATEDLVQKAQGHGGHLLMREDSPDGGEQPLATPPAASRQDVAVAARHAVTTLNSQASLLKSGAARLMAGGNVGGQVLLLTAARDVANTMEDVLTATSPSPLTSPIPSTPHKALQRHSSAAQLFSSAKKAAAAHCRLVRTVSGVDANGRVQESHVLVETVDFLKYSLEDFQTQIPWPRKEFTQLSLTTTTKSLLLATNQIVSAARSCKTADIVVGLAIGRSSATELLSTGSALAWNTDTEEDRMSVISYSRNVILAFVALLEYVKREMGEGEERVPAHNVLSELTEAVNSSLQDLLQTAHKLQLTDSDTSSEIGDVRESMSDIACATEQLIDNVTPSNEMTDAAFISASHATGIVQHFRSTTRTCSDLVKCAIDVHSQFMTEESSTDEQQWSHTLMHCASQLSLVISSLCDTVGMYSQSLITERRVASECGAITALASRLFLTILVKTEAGSALHQQLQAALLGVKKATNSLMMCVGQASLYLEEDTEAFLLSLTSNATMTTVPTVTSYHTHDSEKDGEHVLLQLQRNWTLLAKMFLE